MTKLIPLVTLVGLLGACSPVAPGEYVVYRISYAGVDGGDIDPGCTGGTVPANDREDESDIRSADTLGVYKAGDNYYLELGTDVLEGTRSGKTFKFQGEAVNRTYDSEEPGSGFRETQVEIEITMTVNGSTVTGSTETVTTRSCSGQFCDPTDTSTCEATGTFVGSEIKDAELGYNWREEG